MTADSFIKKLSAHKNAEELAKVQRHYKGPQAGNKFLGVRMGKIFELAKEFIDLPSEEIAKLLDSPYYEVRMGGVSVMDFQARSKKTSEGRKKELFDLYIKRHDRINNWDFVDRAAPHVVGGYLFDKPRKILFKLAKSKNEWERRTAIVSTYYFIKNGDVDDTFKIAGILVNDDHELVQKAVGSWVREAGKTDPEQLIKFLDKHAKTMPRVTLRYAIEKFDKATRDYYLKLGSNDTSDCLFIQKPTMI